MTARLLIRFLIVIPDLYQIRLKSLLELLASGRRLKILIGSLFTITNLGSETE